ncbi:hypothetical protein [Planctobacterium marinum]|uniref:Uncharacterized protein n=1 Tax=Planctobacterium marinum TaxID=1631968 RepID=A0AA48KSK4_9ALTE|nr:hypothetical protein MACH26_20950 [Planctobacterium marinum]
MTDTRDHTQVQGTLRLSLDAIQRILFIEATGPFESDFGEKYHAQILPLRDALKPISWGSLALLKGGESLLNDSIRSFLIASIKDARQLGLKVTALVLEPGSSDEVVQWWHSVYQETGLRYQIFEDRQQALSFLTLNIQP